ncbi:copper homeostasis protein CutC [Empedobacter tilapiae]|uniref:PF03932 family protein CutC n=1 Tax=Empedobacter tilapiae TaxID=2491114 RepID=A0A4Z1BNX6_9FLAO|nr:copper homeostasis protein CutC [Empedobacter tilapiae]TGN29237.1 copper homeostasis protein CutC [Empedobacter tilapiae]
MKKIEIACFNLESALIAAKSNTDRIELCADASTGGVTPDFEDIKTLRKETDKEIMVMIRPRGGDFCYSDEEFEQMRSEIIMIKNFRIDGFVFGILNEENEIDFERNQELVELSKPFPCTFHRAFDRTSDAEDSLQMVIDLGFKTILTSGLDSNVDYGKRELKNLVKKAENQITIMPGGGLRSTNIEEIDSYTHATYFHSSAMIDDSGIANLEEINRLKSLINSEK